MSTSAKILLMLLAWVAYTLFVFRSCQKELCLACGNAQEQNASLPATDAETVRYPIDFKWGEATPLLNEGGSDQILQLAASRSGDQLLEITGYYFEQEPKPKDADNLGFTRAEGIGKLVREAGVPQDKLRIRARAMQESEGVRENTFIGFESRVLEPEQKKVETVEQLADRIIIRFPVGSTQMIYDKTVIDYLDQLAAQVQKTGELVSLTGHTDNTGTPERNLLLGTDRAAAIRQILIEKGVKAQQITADSKGQAQPVTTNKTLEGRAENRRVEVRLIRK